MRFFFHSRQFKIILTILICLVSVSIIFTIIGGKLSPQSNIAGAITAPIRSAATAVSNAFSDLIVSIKDGNKIMLENTELEAEINELREQLADYQKISAENYFYKNYLEIKEAHPDFKFAPATLVSRDADDLYKGFVINKGSIHGISEYDPVITDAGLVGFVSQVGLNTSKVITVLSPELTLGALDNRTNDSGIISGSLEFLKNGETKFYNLSRSCNIAVGDYVVTSGEGIFPQGLLIGTIKTVGNDKYNTSLFATVKPFADINNLREVMVITDFNGQGDLLSNSGE